MAGDLLGVRPCTELLSRPAEVLRNTRVGRVTCPLRYVNSRLTPEGIEARVNVTRQRKIDREARWLCLPAGTGTPEQTTHSWPRWGLAWAMPLLMTRWQEPGVIALLIPEVGARRYTDSTTARDRSSSQCASLPLC